MHNDSEQVQRLRERIANLRSEIKATLPANNLAARQAAIDEQKRFQDECNQLEAEYTRLTGRYYPQ